MTNDKFVKVGWWGTGITGICCVIVHKRQGYAAERKPHISRIRHTRLTWRIWSEG